MVCGRAFRYLILLGLAGTSFDASGAEQTSLRGRLAVEEGKPFLRVNGKRILLESANRNTAATLADPRNSGKELNVEGESRGNSFEVHAFHAMRGGEAYRLIYFCDT